ncbi:DoxX family protein [Parachryseolinea silvisoli]|jgi:putative oxidoreductase|uniref:DoxX family protein n=1 Tax=Parachryseolinea silvisoli TaxID=2873601 RepID=UPI0022659787|nr:DoxX family protein [Parachryseolinea silvisoli]MCD9016530.1 DoxX family protein [Parachryseolinea silvisoli]
MKAVFKTTINASYLDAALLIARIGLALLMFTHGIPKLGQFFSDGPIQYVDPIGLGVTLSLALTVFAEVLCSTLLLIGFATRLAAIPLIVVMLVAFFIVHAADPINVKELSMVYLLFYVVLAVTGSGRYSVDYLISRKQA